MSKEQEPLNIGIAFSHEYSSAEFWARNVEDVERLVDLYLKKLGELK